MSISADRGLVAARPCRLARVERRPILPACALLWRYAAVVATPARSPLPHEDPHVSTQRSRDRATLRCPRPVRGAVTALAMLVVPALALAQTVPAIAHEKYTLPNGLEVILHEDHSVPIVAVNTWYKVGSGDELVGRTGFAHLFEHMMFMGSENVPVGKFDQWLEAAGANNNGSTNGDRTNYYEWLPSNALPLALWLDADRMGWLLPTMDLPKLDLQRDVVKNERRQSYDNVPYGRAFETILAALYPAVASVLVAR